VIWKMKFHHECHKGQTLCLSATLKMTFCTYVQTRAFEFQMERRSLS
jgi:hypothetical protein